MKSKKGGKMGKRDVLRVISRTPGVSLYELVSDENDVESVDEKSADSVDEPVRQRSSGNGIINGNLDTRIKRYIVSTSQTQQITTQAETVSPEFENLLQQGIGATISRSGLADIIRETIGQNTSFVDVLFILRGGLSFDPTTGLGEIGLRKIEHYLSSQRKRIPNSENPEGDNWEIIQDGYRKMFEAETEPRQINLFLGEIVATGTSLKHGLIDFLKEAQTKNYRSIAEGNRVNSITMFSIGGQKSEDILAEILNGNDFHSELFTETFRANIVYLEGRFGLAKKTTQLRIKNPDTDLLAYHEGAIATPEFVRELLTRPEYLLEPCIIYDGGKRRSAHKAHLKEVIEHWETLKKYANNGLRLHTAINERYPIVGVSNVEQWRALHPSWKEVENSVIGDLIREKNFLIAGAPNTTKALRELCKRRLRTVHAMLEPEELRASEESETSQGLDKLKPSAPSHIREHTKEHIREKPTHHIGMTSEFIQHDEPTTILISGEPDRTNRIYRMLDMMERHVKTGRGLPIGKGYLIRMIGGKEYKIPIAVATSGMGFGSTEITTMEMIETYTGALMALKAQVEKSALANLGKPINLIRVGTCGSHQPKVYGGDLVIATKTYCPFGSVSDLIETSHDSALHHFKIGYLRVLEQMFDAFVSIDDVFRGSSLMQEVKSLLKQKTPRFEHWISLVEQFPESFPLVGLVELLGQYNRKILTKLEDAVSYKLAECEVAQSYTCDLDIIRHLQRTSRQLNFDEDKIHTGPVFSKTTLFSEAYHAFSIEPEKIRKRRLDYRSKIMKQLPVYCSEMEIAMMSAVAHLARLKGYDVRVGGIMAVVNNPRDPSRSENPLFADTMTISMAVDRAILLGLEGAVEVYKQQYLNK